VFASASNKLNSDPDVHMPVNVMGVKKSPYGEVIAMAMQGPIENYWTEAGTRKPVASDAPENRQLEYAKSRESRTIEDYESWNHGLRFFIENLSQGLEERTNAFAASDAHNYYLRRQVGKKLRFAYELDPAHYGNYNAYHFFLTQPYLGSEPKLTSQVAKLANNTISYCLNRRVDPRESLTAAAAAGNILEMMLNNHFDNEEESVKYSIEQMRNILALFDQCLIHFHQLSDEWDEQGLWNNLSELRIIEAKDRIRFIRKVRDSQAQAISRLEEGGLKEPEAALQTDGVVIDSIDPINR